MATTDDAGPAVHDDAEPVVHTIVTATEADGPPLAALLAERFAQDPVLSRVLAGRRNPQARLRAYFACEIAPSLACGRVWTTPGRRGVLVVRPPHLSRGYRIRRAVRYIRLFGLRVRLLTRTARQIAQHKPAEPYGHVYLLATARGNRDRTLSRRLLRTGAEECDRQGVPSFLVTAHGPLRAYLCTIGYQEAAPIELLPGVTVTPMKRDACGPAHRDGDGRAGAVTGVRGR